MKKYLTFALVVLIPINSYAFNQCIVTNGYYTGDELPTGCTEASALIVCTDKEYYDCNECKSGYTLKSTTVTISDTESYTYGLCQRGGLNPLPGTSECPEDCPSESEWTDHGTYQAICSTTFLLKTCQYRCATGYYGNGSSCNRCPSSGGVYGTTAGAGATLITECYIPAGAISWTDSTGTYVCGENSYYEE